MREGTKSWLFGCHSVVHSILVIAAWYKLYHKLPKFWQVCCILIHDIGYCGMDYLTAKTNHGHAELGAKLAGKVFGKKASDFILGHSRSSAEKFGLPLSQLEAPDDYSWILAPTWWLKAVVVVEPQLHAEAWREAVKKNWAVNGLHGRAASFELTKKMLAK